MKAGTHAAPWALVLENNRTRPPLVPVPCPYPTCISRHQPAPVRAHSTRPRSPAHLFLPLDLEALGSAVGVLDLKPFAGST